MNILMLVTRRQLRGAEVSAANLSKQLVARGHNIFWVGLFKINTNPVIVEGAFNIDLRGGDSGFLNLKKLFHLISYIKKNNIEIIQANGSDTLKYAVFATLLNKRVRVVYRNISIVSYWINNSKIKRFFFSWLVSRVDHVVSVGQASKKDFMNTYHYTEKNISVINRGIPIHPLDKLIQKKQILKEIELSEETRILIWAGSLSHEKNPLLMLEIAEQIQNNKIPCVILICGSGVLENELKENIEKRNIKNVKLMGYKKDLSNFLAAADLLILTSYIEGVPGVILEAASQKTPVVAVNVGGVTEAIIDNETGFLIDAHDAILFSQKIRYILDNTSLQEKMSKNAFNFVVENYNEDKKTSDFEDLYLYLTQTDN